MNISCFYIMNVTILKSMLSKYILFCFVSFIGTKSVAPCRKKFKIGGINFATGENDANTGNNGDTVTTPTCNDTSTTTHNYTTATATKYIGITTTSSTELIRSATLCTTVATNSLTSDCIFITPITSPIVSISTVKIDSAFQQNSDNSNRPEISNFIQRLSKSDVQFGTPISYETIKDNDEQCFLLTGLKKDVLQCLIIYLKNYHSETYRTGIPSADHIILTLVRLRHMTFEVLAYLRGIGQTTAIEYFWR